MRPQKIVELLLSNGYTEGWIATQARIAQSTVHRLKVGDTRHARYDTAEKLQRIYSQYIKLGENNAAN